MRRTRFSYVKDTEYNIRIAKVRELAAANSLSRWEMLRYAENGISVSLKSRFIPMPEKGQVALIMGTCYHATRKMLRHQLLCYNIEVVFDIDPFPDNLEEDADFGIMLHPRLMTLMYGAAVGALRGMLALRVENTFLKNYPLPLINISALVSERLYGSKEKAGTIPLVDFIYN